METLDSIKNSCLKAVACFQSSIKEMYHLETSTSFLFIPHFINDSKDVAKSNSHKNIWSKYVLKLPFIWNKMDIDRLSKLIYNNQDKISWVDFRLISFKKKVTVFEVELVCLDKRENELNFHIAWPIDFFD